VDSVRPVKVRFTVYPNCVDVGATYVEGSTRFAHEIEPDTVRPPDIVVLLVTLNVPFTFVLPLESSRNPTPEVAPVIQKPFPLLYCITTSFPCTKVLNAPFVHCGIMANLGAADVSVRHDVLADGV
jgi:hypothetical protein